MPGEISRPERRSPTPAIFRLECGSYVLDTQKLQSVAKLVTHSAKFWNFLVERRTTAKKNNVCQISPRPPNQCWSLFPALWSFRVWSTLCRGEGGKFYLGLGCSKIRQKRSSVSLLLKPIVASNNLLFSAKFLSLNFLDTFQSQAWTLRYRLVGACGQCACVTVDFLTHPIVFAKGKKLPDFV